MKRQPSRTWERRTFMTRLVAVFALLLFTGGLASCSNDDSSDPVEVPRTSQGTEGAEQPDTSGTRLFGPSGVGDLLLGMNADEVAETGTARVARGSVEEGMMPHCRWVIELQGRENETYFATGRLSVNRGLETLYADTDDVTPQGVRLGSTVAEVSSAISRPNLKAGDFFTIPASITSDYIIGMSLDGEVNTLTLQTRVRDCPEQ